MVSAIEAARNHAETGSTIPFRLLSVVMPPPPVSHGVVAATGVAVAAEGVGIRDVQHRQCPPRGRLHLCRHHDTLGRKVKEEPVDEKPTDGKQPTDVLLAGYVMSSPLRNDVHDGGFTGMS